MPKMVWRDYKSISVHDSRDHALRPCAITWPFIFPLTGHSADLAASSLIDQHCPHHSMQAWHFDSGVQVERLRYIDTLITLTFLDSFPDSGFCIVRIEFANFRSYFCPPECLRPDMLESEHAHRLALDRVARSLHCNWIHPLASKNIPRWRVVFFGWFSQASPSASQGRSFSGHGLLG
jgi:hypothetical protein